MKRSLMFFAMIIGVASFSIAADQTSTHPLEMGGNDCVHCHAPGSKAENKSESIAYAKWVESRHGINSIKCHTCHGEETTFKPKSSTDVCLGCHPQEVSVIKRKVKTDSIVCVECHTPHDFIVKPEEKFVHK